MLLDEVDKMSTDFRGDPSAALLEVLDPEQNSAFVDHYLDVDYDLSDVMFVATANSLHSIPMPLQDRMEIIHLPGYTEWEKLAIAQQYLIPKEREMNGIGKVALDVSADTIRSIIHHYTKEAGVRSLEREISTICRKLARETVVKTAGGKTTEQIRFRITQQNLPKYLGEPKYRSGKMEEKDEVGLCNGLAVTMHGGELLVTEVSVVPGKGSTNRSRSLPSVSRPRSTDPYTRGLLTQKRRAAMQTASRCWARASEGRMGQSLPWNGKIQEGTALSQRGMVTSRYKNRTDSGPVLFDPLASLPELCPTGTAEPPPTGMLSA